MGKPAHPKDRGRMIPAVARPRNLAMRHALFAALFVAAPAIAADDVKLEPVSIDGLLKAVEAHKGKIVVIDVWANFCVPCKEKFPHMIPRKLMKMFVGSGACLPGRKN